MSTNDMNARSSLSRRQQRGLAPRVECLESRELLTYPTTGVAFLINQALFHHENTAFRAINLVNSALRNELTAGALATLNAAPITIATATTFVNTVAAEAATFQTSANAQLLPRFPFVDNQIVTNAQRDVTGVTAQFTLFQAGTITNTTFAQNVRIIINGGTVPAPQFANATLNGQARGLINNLTALAPSLTAVANPLTLPQLINTYGTLTLQFRNTVAATANLRPNTLANYDTAVTTFDNALAAIPAADTPAQQQALVIAAIGTPTTPNTFANALLGTGGLFV